MGSRMRGPAVRVPAPPRISRSTAAARGPANRKRESPRITIWYMSSRITWGWLRQSLTLIFPRASGPLAGDDILIVSHEPVEPIRGAPHRRRIV